MHRKNIACSKILSFTSVVEYAYTRLFMPTFDAWEWLDGFALVLLVGASSPLHEDGRRKEGRTDRWMDELMYEWMGGRKVVEDEEGRRKKKEGEGTRRNTKEEYE